MVSLGAGPGPWVACRLRLDDLRDLAAAVQRCRRLLGLDADPQAADTHLAADPVLGPLVAKSPGLRVPGTVDAAETAVRAVLGQQVSVAGARTLAGRLVAQLGEPLATPAGTVTHLFPDPATVAAGDPATWAMPRTRARTVTGLSAALADGRIRLDPGADREAAAAALTELPGIGPWTIAYLRLRALCDPDAWLPTDLGVRRGLARLGLPDDPTSSTALAERWRPWRAAAVHHLWRL